MPGKYKHKPGSRYYRNYKVEVLLEALKEIEEKRSTIRAAAEKFGISSNILWYKLKEKRRWRDSAQIVVTNTEETKVFATFDLRCVASCQETVSPEGIGATKGSLVHPEQRKSASYQETVSPEDIGAPKGSLVHPEQRKSEPIWARKAQSSTDLRATDELLKFLMKDKKKLFEERKGRKTKMWEEAAEHLNGLGFNLGGTQKERMMKCHQKWRNLRRSYLSYRRHPEGAGGLRRKRPATFDVLHQLLANNYHRYSPCSEPEESQEVSLEEGEDEGTGGCSPDEDTSRWEAGTPGSSSGGEQSLILSKLDEIMKADRERFDRLEALLKENLQERRRLNDAIIRSLDRKGRGKREDREQL